MSGGRITEEDRRPLFLGDNPYGYRANLLNPKIAKLFEKFKAKRGIPHWCALSDAERKEFDDIIVRYFYKKLPEHLKPKESEIKGHEKSA